MPRRRATKAQTTRDKPKMSATSDEINEMTKDARAAKLANFLSDFDVTVGNLRIKYEEHLMQQERHIEEGFRLIKMKLSKSVKMTPLMKYLEQTMAEEEEEKDDLADLPSDSQDFAFNNPLSVQQTISKYRSQAVIHDTIPEDGSSTDTSTQARKKKRQAQKSVVFNGANPTPQTGSRYITPAMQRSMQCLDWGATPAVTPKFNPRLPITPGLKRQPKPGEILMSLAGSPIEVESSAKRQPRRAQGKTLEIQIPEGGEYNAMLENLEIPDTIDMNSLPEDKFKQMMTVFTEIMKKGAAAK